VAHLLNEYWDNDGQLDMQECRSLLKAIQEEENEIALLKASVLRRVRELEK